MKNIGLIKLKEANVDNFTTITGLKLRRIFNKPLRYVLKKVTKGNIIIDSYPNLEKDKPYIFASTHTFTDEISATLSTIDRSAYTLCGATDQLEHNPKMYFNWLNGTIYIDRFSEKSRKDSILKMEKVLNNGSSILLFPEGGLNNTENLLVMKLFAGPYILSADTKIDVVPISTFIDSGSKNIYLSASEPLSLYKYDKKEALKLLRDALATLRYNQMEKYASRIRRKDLPNDPRLEFMEERRKEYLKEKWTRDVWDEELTVYRDKLAPTPEEVRESVDSINITTKNAGILGPVLVKRLEDKKYDFNKYMHENWQKK